MSNDFYVWLVGMIIALIPGIYAIITIGTDSEEKQKVQYDKYQQNRSKLS